MHWGSGTRLSDPARWRAYIEWSADSSDFEGIPTGRAPSLIAPCSPDVVIPSPDWDLLICHEEAPEGRLLLRRGGKETRRHCSAAPQAPNSQVPSVIGFLGLSPVFNSGRSLQARSCARDGT